MGTPPQVTDRTALVALMLAVDDSLQAARTAYQNGAIDVPHLLFVVQAECERLRFAALAAPTPDLIAEASGQSPARSVLIEKLTAVRDGLRCNVATPDDKDTDSVWVWRLDDWADDLDRILAVLGAPTPRPDQEEWQPIETAPKDGTWILLHAHERGRDLIGSAQWEYHDDCWYWVWHARPTSWRPLPLPPVVRSRAEWQEKEDLTHVDNPNDAPVRATGGKEGS